MEMIGLFRYYKLDSCLIVWVGVCFFLLVMGFGVFLLCSSELEQCQSCLTVSGFWSGGRQVLFKYFSSFLHLESSNRLCFDYYYFHLLIDCCIFPHSSLEYQPS